MQHTLPNFSCDLLRDRNGNFHALHVNLNLFVLCGEYFDLLCDLLWYLNVSLHGLHGNLYDLLLKLCAQFACMPHVMFKFQHTLPQTCEHCNAHGHSIHDRRRSAEVPRVCAHGHGIHDRRRSAEKLPRKCPEFGNALSFAAADVSALC